MPIFSSSFDKFLSSQAPKHPSLRFIRSFWYVEWYDCMNNSWTKSNFILLSSLVSWWCRTINGCNECKIREFMQAHHLHEYNIFFRARFRRSLERRINWRESFFFHLSSLWLSTDAHKRGLRSNWCKNHIISPIQPRYECRIMFSGFLIRSQIYTCPTRFNQFSLSSFPINRFLTRQKIITFVKRRSKHYRRCAWEKHICVASTRKIIPFKSKLSLTSDSFHVLGGEVENYAFHIMASNNKSLFCSPETVSLNSFLLCSFFHFFWNV